MEVNMKQSMTVETYRQNLISKKNSLAVKIEAWRLNFSGSYFNFLSSSDEIFYMAATYDTCDAILRLKDNPSFDDILKFAQDRLVDFSHMSTYLISSPNRIFMNRCITASYAEIISEITFIKKQ